MFLRYSLLLTLFLCPLLSAAQATDSTGVIFHEDPRLAILFAKKNETGLKSIKGAIYSQKGFRVQIYYGNDRNTANQRKIDFIRRFPGVASYLSYVAPSFRLKVGNFKTRAEAYELYRQLSPLYAPCMVVPDIVVINSLKNAH